MGDDVTEYDLDVDQLMDYGSQKEQQLYLELNKRQENFQDPQSDQEKKILEKYGKFLTFKAHGSGAFGSVTEYYDLYRRQKFAKKQFSEIQDLKIELDCNDRIAELFSKEEMESIMACICRMDIDNNSLFYESGIITLNDFVQKRRNYRVFWYEREEEIGYIAHRLCELILKLYSKNVFHSDLKLVNTVICKDEYNRHFLKLIDLGGATFEYNYLVAVTLQYFPDMDEFQATKSKQNRILAEFYQMGRMIQEICLSSIYSKQEDIYMLSMQFPTYKDFKKYYFENTRQRIKESMEIIKIYYSDKIVRLIDILLGLKSNVKDIQKYINGLKKNEYLEDEHTYVSITAEDKVNSFFNDIFNNGKKDKEQKSDIIQMKEEFNFYQINELENQGIVKTEEYINSKYKDREGANETLKLKFKEVDLKDGLIFLYDMLFQNRLMAGTNSPLIDRIQIVLNYSNRENEVQNLISLFQSQGVDQHVRNLVFIECYLCSDSLRLQNNTDRVSYEQKLDILLRIFNIKGSQQGEFEKILEDLLPLLQNSKIIIKKEQDLLEKFIKRVEKYRDQNKVDEKIEFMCNNLILELHWRKYLYVNQISALCKSYEQNKAYMGMYLAQYSEETQKFLTEEVFKDENSRTKYIDMYKLKIQDQPKELYQKFQGQNVKQRNIQTLLQNLAMNTMNNACTFNQATRECTIHEKEGLMKAHEYALKAKLSMDQVKPCKYTITT